jgi:uncharacterized OsmC-like protein
MNASEGTMPEEMTTKHAIIRLARAYEFIAEFPDLPNAPAFLLDEPTPLGDARGPNATDVLAAAVGDCLSASLAFCLRKTRVKLEKLTTNVTTHLARNDQGRMRIESIDVELAPELRDADPQRLARCQAVFEDFCTVTASIRKGIAVNVSVKERAETAAA